MTWRWRPPVRRSLRLYLLTWQLGALALCALAVVGLQALRTGLQLAQAQDAALRLALDAALAQVVAATPAHASGAIQADAMSLPGVMPGLAWRVSAMTGEWLMGDQTLPPCPWRATLPLAAGVVGTAGGSVVTDFYLSQSRGRLVRMAAVQAKASGPEGPRPVVVQVALPWADRLPSAAQVLDATVRTLLWVLALLGAAAVALAHDASRWLLNLRGMLHADPDAAAATQVPDELAPMVDSARQAIATKQRWVDEQREFLADASHQLRTPLAVLRAQLQSLATPGLTVADTVPAMLKTVDRATHVANQLLGLKKLDQQRRQGLAAPVSLWPVCRDAAVELSPLVLAKRLDFELSEFELEIQGEPTLLGELVRNLLANAIHHAPHGARMGIVLRQCADRRELIVWDEGPGIDDALQPRLFHPFAAAAGGTGLGLSICRQIAEASGATIALFNRVDGDQVVGVDAVVSWGQGP